MLAGSFERKRRLQVGGGHRNTALMIAADWGTCLPTIARLHPFSPLTEPPNSINNPGTYVSGRDEVVRSLLDEAGNKAAQQAELGRRNVWHLDALMAAAQRGHASTVSLLLKRGAPVQTTATVSPPRSPSTGSRAPPATGAFPYNP